MALAYHRELDGDTSFAVWKIEESAGELLAQLQLKDHELNYLEKLNNGKRSLHWLSTRVLLRLMVNTSEYIDCQADENGKPYLPDLPYHISLSHSYDYAGVMISRSKAVGIDIELVKTKIERIAGKFLSDAELEFISHDQRIEHLYACWCAKEAVYKLHGKKNISFRDNIFINPFIYREGEGFSVRIVAGEVQRDFQVYAESFDGYMIGYVAE